MNNHLYKKGISVLEILIAISILAVLFSVVIPSFKKLKENQSLKNSAEDIISSLRSAQSETLASVDSSEYGVHFQADEIVIFKGQTFSSGVPENKIINIVYPSSISNVTLGGISSTSGDLFFYRLSGTPSKTGTITITNGLNSKVINISATGAVNIN